MTINDKLMNALQIHKTEVLKLITKGDIEILKIDYDRPYHLFRHFPCITQENLWLIAKIINFY